MMKVGMKLRANRSSQLDGVTKGAVYVVSEVFSGPSLAHFKIVNDRNDAVMPVDSDFTAAE